MKLSQKGYAVEIGERRHQTGDYCLGKFHQCIVRDDVQVATFGHQIIGKTVTRELARLFLSAKFSTSEEFRRRVEKFDEIDASR